MNRFLLIFCCAIVLLFEAAQASAECLRWEPGRWRWSYYSQEWIPPHCEAWGTPWRGQWWGGERRREWEERQEHHHHEHEGS